MKHNDTGLEHDAESVSLNNAMWHRDLWLHELA